MAPTPIIIVRSVDIFILTDLKCNRRKRSGEANGPGSRMKEDCVRGKQKCSEVETINGLKQLQTRW